MDYLTYDIADFAADKFFVTWVLSPDPESDDFWRRWLAAHPDRKQILHAARLSVLMIESQPAGLATNEKTRIWHNIQHHLAEPLRPGEMASTRVTINRRKFAWNNRWLKAAASLIIFAGLWYTIMIFWNGSFAGYNVAENSKGKKSVIYLPDGTKVWLNAESRITYPSNFRDANEREVSLVGEAFFEVTENPAKPFIVTTSDLQVKVLGTAFNVKSYERDKRTAATLLHGKVMIELNQGGGQTGEAGPVILRENQQVVYSSDSREFSLNEVEAETVASWKEGKLVFVNKPVSEIEIELERWYGVEITVEGKVNDDCRFSTTIENEPITRILELFRTTSDITYTINDNLITIKGNLCP